MMPKHAAPKRPVCYECDRRIWPWQHRDSERIDEGEWTWRHWSLPCPSIFAR